MGKIRYNILIFIILMATVCHAQTDTAFWFAAPDFHQSDYFDEIPIRFVFHSYDQPATVTVEQPANSFFPTSTVVLPSNGVAVYDLSDMVSMVETTPINTVLDRGLYIHSTAPISCYYQNTSVNRETYTLKGRNALGTDFQVLIPHWIICWGNGRGGHENIEIVATEDSTEVWIIPPSWPGNNSIVLDGGITSADTVKVILNRGQCYAAQSYNCLTDLIKTVIHSTKPIAVNATHDPEAWRMQHMYRVGEQLLPIDFWGKKYVLFQDWPSGIDNYRVIDCVDSGTYQYSIGGVVKGTLTGGSEWTNYGSSLLYPTFDLPAYDTARLFEFGYPVGVLQRWDDSSTGVGFSVLPDIDFSGSHQISYLCTDSLEVKIQMVVGSEGVNHILFNGDSTVLTAADFQPLVGDPSHSWCCKKVTDYLPIGGVMNIRCDSSLFVLGVIEYDSVSGLSYTILTDYAPPASVSFNMDFEYCEGDSIRFSYTTHNITHVMMRGPDGMTREVPDSAIVADTSMSGRYWLYGYRNQGDDPIVVDSIDIMVYAANSAEWYDTIVQRQLPWSRFDLFFYAETDTTIRRPDTTSRCDSIIYYHLFVYHDIYDTVHYYACEGDLPVQYDTAWFSDDGEEGQFLYPGSHGEDSIVTFILHVIPNRDTILYDTILENQLPWFVLDTVFNDTVADYIFRTISAEGCDSLVHYNLFIFWDGDHCDTSLTYPNVVTPNGDGMNDRFVIGGLLEHNCFKYNELLIYDRTGRCIYHKHNIASESDWWDPAGQHAPSGTYFFYFKAHGVNIWTQHFGVIEVLHEK